MATGSICDSIHRSPPRTCVLGLLRPGTGHGGHTGPLLPGGELPHWATLTEIPRSLDTPFLGAAVPLEFLLTSLFPSCLPSGLKGPRLLFESPPPSLALCHPVLQTSPRRPGTFLTSPIMSRHLLLSRPKPNTALPASLCLMALTFQPCSGFSVAKGNSTCSGSSSGIAPSWEGPSSPHQQASGTWNHLGQVQALTAQPRPERPPELTGRPIQYPLTRAEGEGGPLCGISGWSLLSS